MHSLHGSSAHSLYSVHSTPSMTHVPLRRSPTVSTAATATTTRITRGAIVRNFASMAVCFALNHGTVSAVLALATSSLGERQGGVASGALYFAWVLSSCAAPLYMPRLGRPLNALTLGMACYAVYCLSNLLAVDARVARPHSPGQWALSVGGAVVGGVGAGPLFVGESVYFARMAAALARADGAARRTFAEHEHPRTTNATRNAAACHN